jgi:hypothetical protein
MDRRTRSIFALLFLGLVVATGLAVTLLGTPPAPPVDGDPPPGTTAVRGVIVVVDSQGLGDVRGFTLRTDAGEVLPFSLRALENGTTFPPGHLAEHQATAEPVEVWFREEAGERLAIRIDDAPR